MMAMIYKMAEAVLVWLPETVGLEGGAGRFKNALESLTREEESIGCFENAQTDSDAAWEIRLRFARRLLVLDKDLLRCLKLVLCNEYWGRV